jgi:hypothetical protein
MGCVLLYHVVDVAIESPSSGPSEKDLALLDCRQPPANGQAGQEIEEEMDDEAEEGEEVEKKEEEEVSEESAFCAAQKVDERGG